MKKQENEDLSPYKKYGMTLLQLMGLLLVVGIVGEIIYRYFF
jgi:Tfp pilus assembly protein PilE